MAISSAYRFELARRSASSYVGLKLPDIRDVQLGVVRPSINLSQGDQPTRLPIIHKQFNKATVYYASERDYQTLWEAIGPKNADVDLNGAFVSPEHRLIVIRLITREIPPDTYKRGCAKLSDLRQEEIHQSIRYGLNRLRGADEVKAQEGVSPRIHVERRSAAVPSGLLHGDPKSRFLMLSAGSVRVYVVDSETWKRSERTANSSQSSASSEPFIIRQVTPPGSDANQLECVTTSTHFSALIRHLISENDQKNDRETAVSVWALAKYATDCSRSALTKALECRAAGNGVSRQGVDLHFIAKNLVSLAELQNSETPPAREAQGRIWFNILLKLSPNGPTNIDETLAKAGWILEVAKQRHSDLQCDPEVIKKLVALEQNDRIARPIPPELITRLDDRKPHKPHQRLLIAERNGLHKRAPVRSPKSLLKSLINHQRGRVEPGPAKDLFIKEIRDNSLIPIDTTWGERIEEKQPWDLPGATYLQVKFTKTNFAVDLIDLGLITAVCEIRWHSRTQTSLEEHPSYRYTLERRAPLGLRLELLGIRVVDRPTPQSPPCVYPDPAQPMNFLFWHPNFHHLGLRGVPIGDLGLYVSRCQQFVFGRSFDEGRKLVFADRHGNALSTALPETLRNREPQLQNYQRVQTAKQLAEYFKNICHDSHIPARMNIALESLDIE